MKIAHIKIFHHDDDQLNVLQDKGMMRWISIDPSGGSLERSAPCTPVSGRQRIAAT